MKYVENVTAMRKFVDTNNEIIVWAQGGEGTRLMDYLDYVGRLGRVLCLAQVGTSVRQYFYGSRAYVHLNYLAPFKTSALFLVAAPVASHEAIETQLKKFGARNVVFLSEQCNELVINWINDFQNSSRITMWAMKNIITRLDRIEQRVNEQLEVAEANRKAFAEYQDAFTGKEVVIVSTGASVKYYNPIPGAIHIGESFAWKRKDIPFDFLFTAGTGGSRMEALEAFGKVKERVFMSKYFDAGVHNAGTFSLDIDLASDKIYRYYPVAVPDLGQVIYQDICNHPLADFSGGSTDRMISALHFALYTQPKRIYLVGFDANQAAPFYDEANPPKVDYSRFLKLGLARMRMFGWKYYRLTEIVAYNPVGARGIFKDVYNDAYKASLKAPKTK